MQTLPVSKRCGCTCFTCCVTHSLPVAGPFFTLRDLKPDQLVIFPEQRRPVFAASNAGNQRPPHTLSARVLPSQAPQSAARLGNRNRRSLSLLKQRDFRKSHGIEQV